MVNELSPQQMKALTVKNKRRTIGFDNKIPKKS